MGAWIKKHPGKGIRRGPNKTDYYEIRRNSLFHTGKLLGTKAITKVSHKIIPGKGLSIHDLKLERLAKSIIKNPEYSSYSPPKVRGYAAGIAEAIYAKAKKLNMPSYDDYATKIADKIGGLDPAPRQKNIERKLSGIAVIVTFVASLFFASSNLTGYSISNLEQNSSNCIGVILFAASLILLYFYKKS